MPNNFMTVEEVSEALRLSKFTIRQWVAARRIEHVRFGRAVRIPSIVVQGLIESGTVPARRAS